MPDFTHSSYHDGRVPWYHDGSGRPSSTCRLCQAAARCPRCRLLIEAHEVLPCQGEKVTP
jgi:hypothetical protein